MKKIVLIAISALFVVGCSEDQKSAMGLKNNKGNDIAPLNVVFESGQNEPDFSGCAVGPSVLADVLINTQNVDSATANLDRSVTCPSTNGLTVDEAVKVNDLNKASLEQIKVEIEAEWNAGGISDARNAELHAAYDATERAQEKVDGVDVIISSGLMTLEEADVLSQEIALKEESVANLSLDKIDDIDSLNKQLASERFLLNANRQSGVADTAPVLARMKSIKNKIDFIKLEELKAERDRLLIEGEKTIVNSTIEADKNYYGAEMIIKKKTEPGFKINHY